MTRSGPTTELPLIDVHAVTVRADQEQTWDAIADVASSTGGRFGPLVARALGCSNTDSDFPRTVVGFRVADAARPTVLCLRGEHRFSRYQLQFTIEAPHKGTTILRAESRAEFPGTLGRIYRVLVIGTRGHVVAVRRLLNTIRRRAERR